MSQGTGSQGSDPRGASPRHVLDTPDSDTVVLKVFYKEWFPTASDDVDLRLRKLMEGTGVMVFGLKSQVMLFGMERPIKHVEWTRILHWLMTQPEVRLAIRTMPVTSMSIG